MKHKPIPKLTDKQLRNFWRKVNKRGPDDCWEWLAYKNSSGYGFFALLPLDMFLAHRIMYYLATGKQPGPLHVCHACDNPGCCNPAHFFLGTHADNMADKVAKGRSRPLKGVDNGRVKLTERQVLEIRASGETQDALAVKYGVSQGLISSIRVRRTWKHV